MSINEIKDMFKYEGVESHKDFDIISRFLQDIFLSTGVMPEDCRELTALIIRNNLIDVKALKNFNGKTSAVINSIVEDYMQNKNEGR